MPVTLDLPTLVLNAGEARAVLTGTVKDKLGWSPECQAADDRLREAVTRLGAALIAAEGMAEALEPFAKEAEAYEPDEGDSRYAAWGYSPLIGDLRTARERLQSYRAHHPQPAAQANEEPAHIFPCDGEGGNDFIRCRTCGQEWAYARTSGPGRPACPQTHQSPGPSAPAPDPRATPEMVEPLRLIQVAIQHEGWCGEHFASTGHLHLTDEEAAALARSVASLLIAKGFYIAQRDTAHAAEVARLREEARQLYKDRTAESEIASRYWCKARDAEGLAADLRARLDAVTAERDAAEANRGAWVQKAVAEQERAEQAERLVRDLRADLDGAKQVAASLSSASTALQGRLNAAEAGRDAALALLREVEWKGWTPAYPHCPSCNAPQSDWHQRGCRLSAALSAGQDAEQS